MMLFHSCAFTLADIITLSSKKYTSLKLLFNGILNNPNELNLEIKKQVLFIFLKIVLIWLSSGVQSSLVNVDPALKHKISEELIVLICYPVQNSLQVWQLCNKFFFLTFFLKLNDKKNSTYLFYTINLWFYYLSLFLIRCLNGKSGRV